MAGSGPGCVKTLRGITAPRILRLVVTLRAKKAKIHPSLSITTKSDFVFTQAGSISAAEHRDRHGRTCSKTGRQRGQLLARGRLLHQSVPPHHRGGGCSPVL